MSDTILFVFGAFVTAIGLGPLIVAAFLDARKKAG